MQQKETKKVSDGLFAVADVVIVVSVADVVNDDMHDMFCFNSVGEG